MTHPLCAGVAPRVVANNCRGVGWVGVEGARRKVSPRKFGLGCSVDELGGWENLRWGGRREREAMWDRDVGLIVYASMKFAVNGM